MLRLNDNKAVIGLVEKPELKKAPSNLASIGRYILTPDIFGILEKLEIGSGGEIQLADAINQMANLGKVDFSLLRGRRFDCGSVRGYLEAIKFIAEKQNLI